jgi:hypothetical protein
MGLKNKTMSNKKQTPVSWLDGMIGKMEQHGADLPALRVHFDKAFQMEAKNQQKYDEMVAMLEECFRFTKIVQDPATSALVLRNEIEQLIKEAKEL